MVPRCAHCDVQPQILLPHVVCCDLGQSESATAITITPLQDVRTQESPGWLEQHSQRTSMFAPGHQGVGHLARVSAELAQLMIEVTIGIMEDGATQCLHRSEGHHPLVNLGVLNIRSASWFRRPPACCEWT